MTSHLELGLYHLTIKDFVVVAKVVKKLYFMWRLR
uniref:Uncharacterized protein n=1 Tax=Rhizophora mucronata TaxID=61149 RepID=A0A2P2PN15_RHIMU